MEDIQTIIEDLKKKAPGPDGITAEMFKILDQETIEELTNIYKTWWETENINLEWTRALLARIYKKATLRIQEITDP